MNKSDMNVQARTVVEFFWAQTAGEFFDPIFIVIHANMLLQPVPILSTVITIWKRAGYGTPSGQIWIVHLHVLTEI